MLAFLRCVNFLNKLDKVTNYFNFKSIHCTKYESAKILIQLVAVFNLFTLEVVQKCQHCQLCELRENSNVCLYCKIKIVAKCAFVNCYELTRSSTN